MQLILRLLAFLTPYGPYAYPIMFFILLACGFGLPIPEDITLVVGGVLAATGITSFTTTVAVCMGGVLIGDSIVFGIGRKVGPRIRETRIYGRIMSPGREKQVMSWFGKYGDKVIFFARFLPGLRMPLFLTAGIYQVSPLKFVALDGVAALISVPVWVWVGYLFGSNLELLAEKVHHLQFGIYGLLGIIFVLVFAIWYLKKKIKPESI